jgi:hypothetical protein
MSTMEMPACLALLLVMANLALCLSTDNRRPAHLMNLPSVETLTDGGSSAHCSKPTRPARPC